MFLESELWIRAGATEVATLGFDFDVHLWALLCKWLPCTVLRTRQCRTSDMGEATEPRLALVVDFFFVRVLIKLR